MRDTPSLDIEKYMPDSVVQCTYSDVGGERERESKRRGGWGALHWPAREMLALPM